MNRNIALLIAVAFSWALWSMRVASQDTPAPSQVMLGRLCGKLLHEAVYAKDTSTLSVTMADGLIGFAVRCQRQIDADGSTRTFTRIVEQWRAVVKEFGFQGGARIQATRAAESSNNNIATWDIGNWPVTAAVISLNTALLENGR